MYQGTPWSGSLIETPSLLRRLSEQVAKRGFSPAITTLDSSATPQTCTYGELWRLMGEERRVLEQAGVGPGDVCGIRVSNTLRSVVQILSVIATGAAALLVDAQESESRSDEMVNGAATVDVRRPGGYHRIREPRTYEGVLSPTSAHRPIVYVFTTGSTAASKVVVQSDYSVTLNALAVAHHHGLTQADTLACPLPISHVNGLEFGVIATLLRGAHCLLFREFDPFYFMRALAEHDANLATTVPSLLRAISSIRSWPRLERLRYFATAAAPLPESVLEVLHEKGVCAVQGYGLSETMNFSTIMPYESRAGVVHGCEVRDGPTRIPSVGSALFGNEVAVMSRGSLIAPGEEGEVVIRGHSVMSGYWGNEIATQEAFYGGWFHTGDLGLIAPSERYPGQRLVYLTGRLKNVVKCAGMSISLDELDRQVGKIGAVVDACAASRPDHLRGEAVTVFYVAGPGGAADERVITEACARVATPTQMGLTLVEVTSIPRLRSGKPDRPQLAARAAGAR